MIVKEVTEMNMPGFTAEFTLYKGSECYYQKARDVVASRYGTGILPARRIQSHSHHSVKSHCEQSGGVWFPESATNATYGCLYPDDTLIVCGGITPAQKNSCDTDNDHWT